MDKTVEVYETKPEDFNARLETAVCYVECDGRLLLLLNPPGDEEEGAWGVPGGKLEGGETSLQGAKRELFEETSIAVQLEQIQVLGTLYIRKPEIDYVFHMFFIQLPKQPFVCVSKEHQDYRWVSDREIGAMTLMVGGAEAYAYARAQRGKL